MKFIINSLEIQPMTISIFALLAVCILLYKILWNHGKSNKNNRKTSSSAGVVEIPGAWPIIGHLHLFNGNEQMFHKLGSLADQYGPAPFFIRFGSRKYVVVSNWELVKTCFTTHSQIFVSRPPMLAMNILFFPNDSLSYIHYGDHWRELRKISSTKLLSSHRVETQKHLIASEVDYCFKQLYKLSNNGEFALVRMNTWCDDLTLNVHARIIAGIKNYVAAPGSGEYGGEARRYRKALDEGLALLNCFTISDVVPWLGWLDHFRDVVGRMKRCGAELDSIFATWVEEHRLKRASGKGGNVEPDFIDLCWESMEQLPGNDPATVIKLMCKEHIFNGSGTSSLTLAWILSLIMNNPYVIKKAREELEKHVGNHRQVEESDLPNLLYIQAIIKEGMRLYTPGPFIDRNTTEDYEINGVHIPAGACLYVNLWKIHRDPSVYEDPLEFKPERFLNSNSDLDLKGQNYQLLPFGAGRRICPGVSLALPLMYLTVARLIHGYEMMLPKGVEKADMTAHGGVINQRAYPLEVLLRPRLTFQQA